MKPLTSIYIEESKSVTDDMIQEAERIENNSEKLLALIDFLFINDEKDVILS